MNFFRFLIMLILLASLSLSGCGTNGSDLNVKNIILLIADGCGYNQVNASNLYRSGRTGSAVYESFPVVFAVSTYSASSIGYDPEKMWASFGYAFKKPTDSAAAATALACGLKTYNGILGMDTTYTVVENIAERAEVLGKSSGVVTTVPFNHATPAGFAAHDSSRGHYATIGRQMIMGKMEVIMGCGHPEYDDNGQPIPEPDYSRWGGPEQWQALKDGKTGKDADGDGIDDPWTFIDARSGFEKLMNGETPKRVFGLAPAASTLQQNRNNGDPKAPPFDVPFNQDVPDLAGMTRGALNVLDNDPDGFFIMIEGGAVDWAGHANQSGRVIEEEIDFDKAVEAVIDWVETNSSWQETLVMVTGDHETGYLSGPGSGNDSLQAEGGIQAVWVPLVNNGKGIEPGMEWHSGGHTNQLIPFYAKGAGSGIFKKYADQTDPVRGLYIDNTEVAKAMFDLWRKK